MNRVYSYMCVCVDPPVTVKFISPLFDTLLLSIPVSGLAGSSQGRRGTIEVMFGLNREGYFCCTRWSRK